MSDDDAVRCYCGWEGDDFCSPEHPMGPFCAPDTRLSPVGERQTEPHQAGVGPSPREALEALERADLRDRAETAEAELARVRAERDKAREQVDWTVQRCNAAMGDGFKGTPNSAVAAVCDALKAAETRSENQAAEIAEIVALIRSYADVHMTKALADLIEHKYIHGKERSA